MLITVNCCSYRKFGREQSCVMANTVKKPKYTYSRLNEARVNSKVNVFGVVKFLKQPYKTRGSDYCLVISLVDESFPQPEQSLKCLLFAKQEDLLPLEHPSSLEALVAFHISEFRGTLQGQSSPGFSWLLFSGDTDSPLEPVKTSSASYQVTEEDKEQVRRLRQWACGKEELVEKLSTFHQVGANCYFDLVCQVVSVGVVEPGVCLLLRVWDGTRTIYQLKSLERGFKEDEISTDVILEERAEDLLYDIFLYDNHFQSASKIKPGAFVKFINLHAVEHKSKDIAENQSMIPYLEFILHRGDSFGRGIRVLSPDSQTVKSLKERLDKLALPNLSSDTEFTFMNTPVGKDGETSEAAGEVNTEADENGNAVSETKGNAGELEGTDEVTNMPQSDPRCMLQTKTVVLNHPHVKRSTVQEVLEHEGPGKFRVCARVLTYHPVANQAVSFLKLYCRICHHLCELPHSGEKSAERTESQLEVGSSFKGVKHYLCPPCLSRRNSLPELDSPPHLSYIFMLRFILKDKTGMLVANVWRSDAITFFKNIEPEDVLQNSWQFSQIQDMLREICPEGGAGNWVEGGARKRDRGRGPWIECCLRTYTVNSNRNYQIFDTAIV